MTQMANEKDKDQIDRELIRDLAALLTETDLTEIEIERDDYRVRVSRASAPANVIAPTNVVQPAPPPTPVASEAPSSAPAAAAAASDPARHAGAVPSPMVGTVYVSPEPDAAPFVSIGDTVKEGDTLMIVEAMKHMNEVAAPRSGTIAAILVEDGQPIEYGEPLLIIE